MITMEVENWIQSNTTQKKSQTNKQNKTKKVRYPQIYREKSEKIQSRFTISNENFFESVSLNNAESSLQLLCNAATSVSRQHATSASIPEYCSAGICSTLLTERCPLSTDVRNVMKNGTGSSLSP